MANGAPQGLPVKAYNVVDMHIGAKNAGLTISVFAKNLLDERAYLSPADYFNDALGLPIDIKAPVLQPRTVGVSMNPLSSRNTTWASRARAVSTIAGNVCFFQSAIACS